MFLFKDYAVKDWVGFAEVHGMIFRVGRYGPGPSRRSGRHSSGPKHPALREGFE
jgi:phage gp29-like protein